MQVTYKGGASVRRMQWGRKVVWQINGQPVSEETAQACMREAEVGARP